MRKLLLLLSLPLCMVAARAQHGMQVWYNGKYVLFPIANVDSVRFVCLVTGIDLSHKTIELKEGETVQLTATVYPMDADDKTVAWESSMPGVASVSTSGLVTAVSAGSSVITATVADGSGIKAECQVTVTKAGGDTGLLTCPDDNHPHAIDLGLPSGTKWCCCNVGASTPEGYGDYFAWGETSEKSVYNDVTYKYYNGQDTNGDGWIDQNWSAVNIGSDIAGSGYDAATVNMGAPWRMPSVEQMRELVNNCSRQWTQQNGVNGILVTGCNGGQIFLPAAGRRWLDDLHLAGSIGDYWSSSLFPSYGYSAYCLFFNSDYWNWNYYRRSYGFSVRAVRP